MDIKPIETVYNGYRFRSRLEARWAVFFDELGLKWGYETEGFTDGKISYLPDFIIYDWNLFIEIKPLSPSIEEVSRCEMIAENSYPIALFYGLPGDNAGLIWLYEVDDCGGGFICMDAIDFVKARHDSKIYLVHMGLTREREFYRDAAMQTEFSHLLIASSCLASEFWRGSFPDFIDSAYSKAKQARFEFGRNGN